MDAFAALADPIRRDLLAEVAVRPMRVVDLAAGQAISRPAISRHLRLLGEAGLIEATAHGRERHYALRREPLGQVHEFVERLMQTTTPRVTGPMLDALDTEVRRTTREHRNSTFPASHETTPGSSNEETA